MNWMSTIGGLLQQYTGPNANTGEAEAHFDQVSKAVPSSDLGGALAGMFRSSETPPFAQLAGQLFGNANGSQKASVLNELLANAGPAVTAMLGSAGFGALASKAASGQQISPEAADAVPPEVVQQISEHVERHDPSIVDRLSAVYAEHPTLIKTLGGAALAVTMAKLANR